MPLIATVAVWVVAVAAAGAVGGHRLGGLAVAPLPYAAVLAVGVGVVAAGRRPPAVSFPERWRGVASGALLFGALYLFSGDGGVGGAGLVADAPAFGGLLVVPALALLWPQPAALRGAVAASALSLLAPDASPTSAPLHLAAMVAGSAVALVITNHLSVASGPALGDRPVATSRRLAGHAGAVAAVLLVAALLSTVLDAPQRRSPPRQGEAAERAEEQQPTPLTFTDVLDPNDAGSGASGDEDEILLRVRSSRADVWRAITYDRWDGGRWHRSAAVRGFSAPGARFVPVPGQPLDAGELQTSSQRVRVEAAYAEVAVGAPQVQYFELAGGAQAAADGTVGLVPPAGRGSTYEAHSMRAVATEAELRRRTPAAPVFGGARYVDVGGVSRRARALAADITAGAPTAYDKVRALERWLDANVEVDDEAPPLDDGADPVDAVLFTRRVGSPERLATALAVLARTVGVPTRLAMGFLPGDRPLLGGDFVVRARHAHAWVEVPFPGLGWQRFDPTGRIARAEAADSFLERLKRFVARWWPVLLALVLGGLAVLVRSLVLRRRRRLALPWVTRYFARLARLGADRGRPRRPSETPAEYTAALADGVVPDERLRTVGELVTEAAWSGREPPEDARRWAEAVLEEATASSGK